MSGGIRRSSGRSCIRYTLGYHLRNILSDFRRILRIKRSLQIRQILKITAGIPLFGTLRSCVGRGGRGFSELGRICIKKLPGGDPEDGRVPSGEADQETVYLGEGALFRESGFGYGKPCGYGAVKAGQSSDPAPYHAPVLETECPEFEGSTVPCPDPAEVDLEDAGLIVSCDL